MPVNRIPIDGLWRCLCPSIDSIVIARSSHSIFAPRNVSMRSQHSTKKLFRPRIRIQAIHSSPRTRIEATAAINSIGSRIENRRVHANTSETLQKLDKVPTTHIHDSLRAYLTQEGRYHEIASLVHYLIAVRGEKPARLYYDALIRANADAENGSAAVVAKLLKEMKDLSIFADAGVYHGVLLVLAIHPDYVLRNQVMQEMKERWIGLSPEGWHHLVIGLIRDRQYESAMDKLEQMQSDRIEVQPWLYDIFMYQLCESGELDEALSILRYRFENSKAEVHPMMWYYLLDIFSSGFHYEGTKYIWYHRVRTSYISPSDGMCLSVLNLAARYADSALATTVIRILSSRRTSLASYHYEALLEAYVGSGDLKTSLRILIIMSKAGIEPDVKTTRPLFLYLSHFIHRPQEAWGLLQLLYEDGHQIPVGAINVILEANVALDDIDESIAMYKQLHTICTTGPNTETFNILLRGLSQKYGKDTAMFLAAEMRALNVKPNELTYDRLILICLQGEDYEDSFNYLEEMKVVGISRGERWWMRPGTAISLVRRCVARKDERVWELLTEMEKRGYTVTQRLRTWAEQNWNKGGSEELTPWK